MESSTPTTQDPWVPEADFADEINVPRRTAADWRARGKGPQFARFGKHIRYRRSAIDAWIAERMNRTV